MNKIDDVIFDYKMTDYKPLTVGQKAMIVAGVVIVTTIWSISYWGSSILNKINNMDSTLSEQKVIIKEIAKNEQNYEKRLAWIEPAVDMMMKKLWFK